MGFRIRRPSLRVKIIAWSFVPTVIILSAVALVSIYAYQRIAEDLVIQRNQQVMRLSAGQVTTEMNEYVGNLTSLARTAPIYEANPLVQRIALKEASNHTVVFDAGVLILDYRGVVVTAEPERPDIQGQDWSNRTYFRQMVRSPGPVFSDVVTDGASGAKVILVAVPITGPKAEFRGALAGMFLLGERTVSAFYGSIVKLRIGGSATAYLVDRGGQVIYHADADRIGEDFSQVEGVQQVLGGKVGALRTRDVGGNDIVSSFAPVPNTPWGLVTEEPRAALMKPSQGYRQLLLLLLALGVAIPSIVVAFGSGRIAKPIADLISAAKEVAAGNFGRTISAPTGDEIEELAKQFNTMSAELQESYANLEQRVAGRTKDLAALNAISSVASSSLKLDEVLREALSKTMELIGTESGAAYRLDEQTQTLEMMAQHGLSESFVAQTRRLPLDIGLAGQPLLTDQPVIWPMTEYPDSDMRRRILQEGLLLVIGVPLMAKGRMLGALVISTREVRSLSQEETTLLAGIGRQVGMAVENARLYEQAEESAVFAERQRLARELHDAVTQTLFSTSLIADVLPRLWERDPEEGRRRLTELRDLTRGALAEMRTLLHELRPATLTEMSLADLLRQLAEATIGRARIPVRLTVESQCPLDPNVQVALYRIAQEALNNVTKHSGATDVQVILRCQRGVSEASGCAELVIKDNGCGFDAGLASPTEHLGLGIMQERAIGIGASLHVESTPGQGTVVTAAWPSQQRMEQK